MSKYIDTDKLIAEIERFSAIEYGGDTFGDDVANSALNYVLEEIIPSLQQEQPDVDLEKEIEEQINIYYSECEKKLNQMSDDDTDIGFLTLNNFARHFYELGLNAKKEE